MLCFILSLFHFLNTDELGPRVFLSQTRIWKHVIVRMYENFLGLCYDAHIRGYQSISTIIYTSTSYSVLSIWDF